MSDNLASISAAVADRYVLERELGRGGMATVYLAHDLKHRRRIAMKVLRPELASSIGPERFMREIEVAAQLQHPNILPLFDSGEVGGHLYYTMPLVEGESLRDRLVREEQLSLPDAIDLTCQIADALSFAHRHQVIHRDIKPENILLQGRHALVADFGVARAVSQAGGGKLTETGMAIGTPHYMSPEQAHGGGHLDGRSDQYSLACVLYEMLAGQPPFTGPNAMAVLARHSMDNVPSLRVVRSAVPPEVEEAILRALEKTPADRFPSVAHFAESLQAVDCAPQASRRALAAAASRRTPEKSSRNSTAPSSLRRRLLLWGAPLLIALAAGVALRGGAAGGEASEPGFDPRRIAVLYFERPPGSDSLTYLADGLTEALIHELSRVAPLQVISSNGVARYKADTTPIDVIARDLQVGSLVHGTVSQSQDRLRVSVSLIDPQTGVELANKTLLRPRAEIFALQSDLSDEVSRFLRERLGEEVVRRQGRTGIRNAAAWELVQKGHSEAETADRLIASGDTSAVMRQFARAESLYAEAELLETGSALPPTRRGWLAYRRSRIAGSFDKQFYDKWTAIGLTHAERALRLEPNDPDARELRGTLLYWRWLLNLQPNSDRAAKLLADAERDLRASVAANPNQASAWNSLSHLLINREEPAEAKLSALRAYEADPYLTNTHLTLWRLFSTSFDLEDGVEARHWCEEGNRRFPEDPRFAECRLWLGLLQGQNLEVDSGWSHLRRYVQLSPPTQREFVTRRAQMIMAGVLARAGLGDSARALILRSRADATLDPSREIVQWEAVARLALGEKDEAIDQLTLWLATNPQQRSTLGRDKSWWWRDLRSHPRYKALAGLQ